MLTIYFLVFPSLIESTDARYIPCWEQWFLAQNKSPKAPFHISVESPVYLRLDNLIALKEKVFTYQQFRKHLLFQTFVKAERDQGVSGYNAQ